MVIYAPDAENDLLSIVEYIACDKPQAAREWLAKIRQTCNTLAAQAKLGESREGLGVPGCRSFSVGNYVIFFRSVDEGIEIARVVHGSRDIHNL